MNDLAIKRELEAITCGYDKLAEYATPLDKLKAKLERRG
jgi:hypothetical protein